MWDSSVRKNIKSRKEINNFIIIVYKSRNPYTLQPPPKPKDLKAQGLFWNQGLKQLIWVNLNQAIDEFSMYSLIPRHILSVDPTTFMH